MKKILAVLVAAALLFAGGAAALRGAGYHASEDARQKMEAGETNGRITAFLPEEIRAGLIFYPGALVEHAAYAPLMEMLSARGILCLLVQMPLDLAVFDPDAAQGLQQQYPQVEKWIIGGHSLGGAMAAQHAAKHTNAYDGLLLLGAYSAADLSAADLSVFSVYGSEDGVLNREKYEAYRTHVPVAFEELVIDGGCHAFFGDYGPQKGDGEPMISRELQMGITASAVSAWIDTL